MPLRSMHREQLFLVPPAVDELIAADHPARFVGALVDALDDAAWAELGVAPAGDPLGAPAYAPAVLVGVWVYGFMGGIRSSRKLERACREQLPFLWLTGWQFPDHNTLWRFYQAHRQPMRQLLKRTVRTAVKLGLVALAVQAIDGTKIAGNAAKARTLDVADVRGLLERADAAIADLEAQNQADADGGPPPLPSALARTTRLRERVAAALAEAVAEGAPRVNLTDPHASLMKGRAGYVAGYNAQAVTLALAPSAAGTTGFLIAAAEVTRDPDDHAQLLPMITAAHENVGEAAAVSLADAGYHSGENLEACAERGVGVLMPEATPVEHLTDPFHKDAFEHDPATDTYRCPQGALLTFRGIKTRAGRAPTRIYRAPGRDCRACAFFGRCTRDKQGRSLEIGPREAPLREHRTRMHAAPAQELYRLRKQMVEPVFGLLKEHQGMRRFLLRGLRGVAAEWSLVAATFNLKTLARIWRGASGAERQRMVLAWAQATSRA